MKQYTLTFLSFLFIGNSFAQIDSDPLDLHWTVHFSPKKSVYMSKTTLSSTDNVYSIGQYTTNYDLTTTGAVQTIAPQKDRKHAFIQKLNKDGELLWQKDGSAIQKSRKDGLWFKDIVVSDLDNSYILGMLKGEAILDTETKKMHTSPDKRKHFLQVRTPEGALLSTQFFAEDLNFSPTALQLSNNQQYLYVAGMIRTEVDGNRSRLPSLQKRSLDGEVIWQKTLQSDIKTPRGAIDRVVIDAKENIYILGNFTGRLDFDASSDSEVIKEEGKGSNTFVLKLNKTGQFEWVHTLSNSYGNEIKLASNNSIYWVGVANDDLNAEDDTKENIPLKGTRDVVLQQLHTNDGSVLQTKLIRKENEEEEDKNPSLVIADKQTIFVSWISTKYKRKPSGLIEDVNKFTQSRHLIRLNQQLEENWNFSIDGGTEYYTYLQLVGAPTKKYILYCGAVPPQSDLAPGSSSFVASNTASVHFVGKLAAPLNMIPVNRNNTQTTNTIKKGSNLTNNNTSLGNPSLNKTTTPTNKTPATKSNNPRVKYPNKK